MAFVVLTMSGAGCDSDGGGYGKDGSQTDLYAETLEIVGSYTDGYGGMHEIAADMWTQTADYGSGPQSSTFHLEQFDNAARWAAGQNDPSNAYFPGKFSRFDWVTTGGKLFFCQTRYDAATIDEAIAATAADSTDPANSGCGGAFAWSELTVVTN
jgi:hypothetical protein